MRKNEKKHEEFLCHTIKTILKVIGLFSSTSAACYPRDDAKTIFIYINYCRLQYWPCARDYIFKNFIRKIIAASFSDDIEECLD